MYILSSKETNTLMVIIYSFHAGNLSCKSYLFMKKFPSFYSFDLGQNQF